MWPTGRDDLPHRIAYYALKPTTVTVADGALHYDWPEEEHPAYAEVINYDALARFRNIARKPGSAAGAERAARFAERHGPLGLPGLDLGDKPRSESLADWYAWSRAADALIRIWVQDPAPPGPSDYEHLARHFDRLHLFPQALPDPTFATGVATTPTDEDDSGVARVVQPWIGAISSNWAHQDRVGSKVALAVNHWMAIGNVSVELVWDSAEGPLDLQLTSPTLLGSLGIALATMLQKRASTGRGPGERREQLEAQCSSCKQLYIPDRKPNPNRRRFCDGCRKKRIPEQYRDQDKAQRRAKERKNARRAK